MAMDNVQNIHLHLNFLIIDDRAICCPILTTRCLTCEILGNKIIELKSVALSGLTYS